MKIAVVCWVLLLNGKLHYLVTEGRAAFQGNANCFCSDLLWRIQNPLHSLYRRSQKPVCSVTRPVCLAEAVSASGLSNSPLNHWDILEQTLKTIHKHIPAGFTCFVLIYMWSFELSMLVQHLTLKQFSPAFPSSLFGCLNPTQTQYCAVLGALS